MPSLETVAGWAGLDLGSHGELAWEVPLSDFNSGQEVLTSPQFTAGGLSWESQLYPEGNGKESGGNTSLFLCLAGPGDSPAGAGVKAAYSLELLNVDPSRSKRVITDADVFQRVGQSWGCPRFIKPKLLQSPHHGFLHGGKLRIKARLVV